MRPVRAPSTLVAAAILAVAACAPPAASPAARPEPDRPVAPVHDPLQAPWTVTIGGGAFTHAMQLTSELISRVDTVTRVDSSRALLSVEWSRVATGGPARLAGAITAFAVSLDSAAPAPPVGLELPIPFAGLDARGSAQARLEGAPAGPCAASSAITQAVRELFLAPPSRVETGTSWADSADYVICRDSIPLDVRAARRYRVVGAERREGDLVVLIDRESRVTMRGGGRQFGETIAITATGSGTMRLAVRAATGTLVEGSGESLLEMQMRGRRRSQDLTQRTRIVITAP